VIAVITQEESVPKLLTNANPTMALPLFDSQFQLLQMELWAEKDDGPAPEPEFIQVPSHNHGSSSVQDHRCYTTTPTKSHCKKKED